MSEYGYLVDLSKGFQLDEVNGTISTWFQAIPYDTYHHPIHGELVFDMERAKRFAQNVTNNVRGQDLNIDYDHKEGEAAGWVKAAEARPDGLWLNVEWTPTAAQQLREKKYRYFSPDFVDDWVHPVTQQKYVDVLNGGALTNRPFLKGILPINLSETFDSLQDRPAVKLEEVKVDPKLLRKLLGLAEDSTDEQVATTLSERGITEADLKPSETDPPKPVNEPAENTQLTEILATVKELSEKKDATPEVKQLADLVGNMGKQLSDLTEKNGVLSTALQLQEVETRVKKLSDTASEGKKSQFLLPPAVADELKAIALQSPKELSDKYLDTVEKLLKEGMIETKERGFSRTDMPAESNATKRFTEAVSTLQKQFAETHPGKELAFTEAVNSVAAIDPELYEEYRDSVYISGR